MCSLLWEYKDCKLALKKIGWDLNHYIRISKDPDSRFEFETLGSMSRDYQGSRRKKTREGKQGGSKKKSGKQKKEEWESRQASESILMASQVRQCAQTL